jgi:Flp pilus assembly CpaF family ATPase
MTNVQTNSDPPVEIIRSLADRVRQQVKGDVHDVRYDAMISAAIEAQVNAYADNLMRSPKTATIGMSLDRTRLAQRVREQLVGLGELQVLLEKEDVEDIDINGCDIVWVSYADGHRERWPNPVASSDEELNRLIAMIAHRHGHSERQFDATHPELDLRLRDGSRLSAIQAVSKRPSASIRRHRITSPSFEFLVAHQQLPGRVLPGMLSPGTALLLRAIVLAKKNVMISGSMGAGKTTLLRALASVIPPDERIVTIEQSFELGLDEATVVNTDTHLPELRHPDCVAMEERPPNLEGVGSITIRNLVKRSKRMNADRVIVGEVLGEEIVDMLTAMIQGRTGSMCTIHADSATGTLTQAYNYAMQSAEKMSLEQAQMMVAQAIDFIVYTAPIALPPGLRQRADEHANLRVVQSVIEVFGRDASSGVVSANELTAMAPDTLRMVHKVPPRCIEQLRPFGYDFQLAKDRDTEWYKQLSEGVAPSEQTILTMLNG